jgi:prefoldin beta subunit
MAVVEKAPSEVLQAKYRKLEEVRAELVKVQQAKATALRQLEETRAVLEEIRQLEDETQLYKLVGFVLVPTSKANLVKELEERSGDLEARIKKLEKMENDLQQELERLVKEIQSLAQGLRSGGPAIGG